MAFFQTLLNSYKPFQIEENHPDDYRTNFIYSAYNSCYPIVDNTKNTTTTFRKKVAAEAMFLLLAYGINYIVEEKNYGEFEYKGFIWGVSKLLGNATINELKSQGVDENFIQDRIFNYSSLLTEIDNDNRMMYITIILNEKPLNNLIKTTSDFSNVTIDSNLSRDLGEILLLNSSVSQAIGLMKQAMNKSYGLK